MVTEKRLLNPLIVSPSEESFSLFDELFCSRRFSPVSKAKSVGEARVLMAGAEYDIIIIDSPISGENGLELAVSACERSAAGVMLLTHADVFDELCFQAEEHGIYTVAKPVGKAELEEKIRLLAATNTRIKRLRQRAETHRPATQDIKLINRAKLLLMQKLGLSEEKAHRAIEKQAMNTRRTKTEIAKSIIEMYEN